MNLTQSARSLDLKIRLMAFMDEWVYPHEETYKRQVLESGGPHTQPPIMEELKSEARSRGLWNLFLPDERFGSGLTNLEYAPLAEIMGRSPIASEACNCSAPDTGNMEILARFGTPEQQERWLRPLLEGEIRSSFAMTEPDTASSDATNIGLRIDRDGDFYVLNGRKWWATNGCHPRCKFFIVMGKTDPAAAPHRQQSMIIVPVDTPGVELIRSLTVFGYQDQQSHAEVNFADVRVPAGNLLSGEGEGFAISQARLGPGRIHHCMRSVGVAERAIEMMCTRASKRITFGAPVSERGNIQDWIAEARIDIEMLRLLALKTAWLMDTKGNRSARVEIAAIKVGAPRITTVILDRAIQLHGAGGISDDFPLACFWAHERALRIADGPDEVHKRTIARQELGRLAPRESNGKTAIRQNESLKAGQV